MHVFSGCVHLTESVFFYVCLSSRIRVCVCVCVCVCVSVCISVFKCLSTQEDKCVCVCVCISVFEGLQQRRISVCVCVSVNFVNEKYDEKCLSTTFFPLLRRDVDELKIDV